ncbi:AAA family ATPase [Desulfospira joergensenii]|uniref:AAA family ATPase n=1 Tax=Desulfospira joergensenii TaxID=53329 RepID=UPI0003B402CA|nr:AAA family ATPase [Desulfospira joergensenii]
MFSGRTIEGKKLASDFSRVRKGNSCQVLVSGPAGVGKTCLVRQFALTAEAYQGCFVFAKSDLKRSQIPLAPVRSVLNMLVKRVIAEHPRDMDAMAHILCQGLGKDVETAVSIVPALKFLIKAPPSLEKNLDDSPSFLNTLLYRIIELLSPRFKGLVIFLDDIQWLDPASYGFLDYLALAPPIQGVMLIFGYRTLETTTPPLLLKTVDTFQNLDSCRIIELKGLPKRDITAYLRHRLDTRQNLAPFSDLCFEKTRGNPFYLIQMVEDLLNQGVVWLSHGEWAWDLDAVNALEICENVADLILSRLKRIKPAALTLLKYGACCHKDITAWILAAATGFSLEKIDTLLWTPVKLDFLEKTPGGYGFTHDKILEAVDNLITGDERIEIHQKLLFCYLSLASPKTDTLKSTPASIPEPSVFTLLYHYGFFCDRVEDASLKKTMAGHFLNAGEKAREQTAYAQAHEWFCQGKDHYPGDIWKEDYDLALTFFNHCAESAYLSGDFKAAQAFCKTVNEQVIRVEDSLTAGITQIYCLQASNQLGAAMAKGIEVLGQLGIKIPKNPSIFRIAAAILKTTFLLVWGQRLSKPGKKMALNGQNRQIVKVMTALGAVCYNLSPKKHLPYMTAKALEFSLLHGHSPETPSMYITFGMVLNHLTHSVTWGKKFSSAARKIAREWGSDSLSGKEIMLANFFLDHWDLSVDEAARAYKEGQKICLETGDHEYYEYQTILYADHIFFAGAPLDDVLAQIAGLKPGMKSEYGDRILSIRLKVLGNLRQGRMRPWEFGADYLEKILLPDMDISFQQAFYTFCVAFLYGDMDAAHELKRAADQIIENVAGTPLYYHFYFMAALVEMNAGNPKKAAKALKILKWCAKHNPRVYGHKYLIARGEKFRVQGHLHKARHLFEMADKALDKSPDALYEKGLVNEKLGRIAQSLNQEDTADDYFKSATTLFQKWGLSYKPGLFNALLTDQRAAKETEKTAMGNSGPSQSVISSPLAGDAPPLETSLLSMGSISQARSVHAVTLDALQWKTRVQAADGEIHYPTAFGDLPYKMLTFAVAADTVVRATAEDSEEDFFDPAYFFSHHPSALMVIPGGRDKAILLENPKENPDMDTLLKMARTVFGQMENPPGQNAPVNQRLPDSSPDQLQAFKSCCSRLQRHMIQNKAYKRSTLSLASLSQDLGLPERTISDAVNTLLGLNVQAFINSYRIEAVKSEIQNPQNHDKTILEIAFEQGFSSKSAFNKAFKKFTGISPSAYKDQALESKHVPPRYLTP